MIGIETDDFFGVDYGWIKNFNGPVSEKEGIDQVRLAAFQCLERNIRKYRCGLMPFFSVCYADIDVLKTVNDKQGRSEYAAVITQVLKGAIRGSDTFISLGDGEFMVLFHKCPVAVADKIMNTVKSRLEFLSEENQTEPPYSVSFRLYEVNDTEKANAETILAMLRSKKSG